jgi:hypothetical protein
MFAVPSGYFPAICPVLADWEYRDGLELERPFYAGQSNEIGCHSPMKPRSLPSEAQSLVKGNLPSLVLVTAPDDMPSELE